MQDPQYTMLAEFILHEKDNQHTSARTQLVRILSRSSTLPKVDDIFIRIDPTGEKAVNIEPGKTVSIGAWYLSHPVAALLCLRYALEWQIWYKSQPRNAIDPRICDMAACRVAAKFFGLIPGIDKDCIDYIPPELAENIMLFAGDAPFQDAVEKINYDKLRTFHGIATPQKAIHKPFLKIVNYLAYPIEYLMMSGGDQRLKVDPETLLNKYGCRPFPRPEAFSFASSTASSISNTAYSRTQFKRKELIRESFKHKLPQMAAHFEDEIVSSLRNQLSIPGNTEVILTPSGTDVSLLVAALSQAIYEKEIVHILVASNETGSGVPLALNGCHFSDTTAQGIEVNKGEEVQGFRNAEVVGIPLRDEQGHLRSISEVDEEVIETIEKALKAGKQAVLHAINQSKLGYSSPSDEYLMKIKEKYGESVLALIDNSQLRMDPEDINNYLEQGFLMTITGSKFFTGPPFNGALLIPGKLAEKWSKVERHLPEGIKAYFYKEALPEWPLAAGLESGINLGHVMRWYASTVEIERYYKTPLSLRYLGIELFCDHVSKSIAEADFLEPLSGRKAPTGNEIDPMSMKDRKTIFPFFVKRNGKVLNKEELDELYRNLNRDLSKKYENESDDIKRLAAQCCHIGQPVATSYKDGSPSAVVRINLGARVVSESWKNRDSSIFFRAIEEEMIQVDIIIRKIQLAISS